MIGLAGRHEGFRGSAGERRHVKTTGDRPGERDAHRVDFDDALPAGPTNLQYALDRDTHRGEQFSLLGGEICPLDTGTGTTGESGQAGRLGLRHGLIRHLGDTRGEWPVLR